ncbi:MAG TPA: UDP-N-acetylmuramoyl-L-alanyl-D-glutamate--2,6-diaminopimelate ligase [Acidimicrobiales bacterium]|nr:UDP-N-acetylmuramoyl-L-alanyl-D-glutamate--2,6-diaminopimelate ligase [Acidimicrobiales bacterium]
MTDLLEGIDVVEVRGDPDAAEVTSVEHDSRRAVAGTLFCCLPGRHSDGHDHAPAAVAAGAVGLLVERPLVLDVPQAVVPPGQARPAMARIAAALHGAPSTALVCVGVTGTNGKTTVTHLLGAILDAHGDPAVVIGTLGGARTTPEAPELQRRLAEALSEGRRAAVLEVSSHALTEHRVDGIVFDAAVFTNLSHDHLDHHGTMEAYFEAKASLFVPARARLGVVNADDPHGRRLLARPEIPLVAFSSADAADVELTVGRTSFTWRGRRLQLPLSGAHNLANALAAATTAEVLGVAPDAIAAGLEQVLPVPGRFEVVGPPAPFTVVVDYAHTPDGLRAALAGARSLAGGARVLCVFGCGGDRDRAKRPAMGAAAAAGADVVVVTSDNPRSEDPAAIIDEVLAGIDEGPATVVVEPDRALAIDRAVALAQPGDLVVVAGKGHETVIEAGVRTTPFDDRQVAAAAVTARLAGRRPGGATGAGA